MDDASDNTAPDGAFSIERILTDVHAHARARVDGAVADYIPELAKVAPDPFGIAIATVAGKVYTVGDAEALFTIQSVSKALTYCMALELVGRERMLDFVGVEPSGDAFNAIEFDPETHRPFNPLVNAGAITVAGLLCSELGGDAAYAAVLTRISAAAGRPLDLNEAVYRSEKATGHRNRAIGHLLLSAGAIEEPVEEALDLYFRQCSINVTAADLALIGATLANMGEHPVTGEQVFDISAIRDTQAVMQSCGMYDYSGSWAYDVGVPAKSGVGGGIMGVVNRQLGLASFSPRLDRKGNSVRGVECFKRLSDEMGLHAFDPTNTGSAYVGAFFTG